jgi:hypothetical protein
VGERHAALSGLEYELLWSAVDDTTYLIELANGIGEYVGLPRASYRAAVAGALLSLVRRGLVSVGTRDWLPRDQKVTPLPEDEISVRLRDGTAFDPDHADLIVFEATSSGMALFAVTPPPQGSPERA